MNSADGNTRQLLDQFANTNIHALRDAYSKDVQPVLQSLAHPRLNLDSARVACGRIVGAATRIESIMARIAQRRSAEEWIGLLRNLAPPYLPNEAIPFVMNAIWRHGAVVPANPASFHSGWHLEVEMAYSDFLDVFRLGLLAGTLSNLVRAHRLCGKGAKLCQNVNGTTDFLGPDSIDSCIQFYELRRPKQSFTNDVAQPMRFDGGGRSMITIAGLLKRPISLLLANTQQTIATVDRFWPTTISTRQISLGLAIYAQELDLKHRLTPDELLLALRAISSLCLQSFPIPVQWRSDFECVFDESASQKSIDFLASWGNRGAIWYPKDDLVAEIADWLHKHDGQQESHAKLISSMFVDAFSIKPDDRSRIDVLRLDPYPFMMLSKANTVYVDFLAFFDFIRSLIEGSRDTQQTAHGDRFRNFFASWIRDEVGLEAALELEASLTTNGRPVSADLLIKWGDSTLFVECKAFSKSRKFWFGEVDAVQERSRRIAAAVRDTQNRFNKVKKMHPEISDWAICMPDVEFLCPIDQHGWLVEHQLPRVVTPEELIEELKRRGKKNAV